MTSMQQVEQLAELGVDYAGFIFYPKSPRYVVGKINPEELKAFHRLKKVGVFVNESEGDVLNMVADYGLDAVQLHGDETAEFCKALQDKITVIKVFRVRGDEDLVAMLQPYEAVVDYFLFDTKAQEYGGTGLKFDWSVLQQSVVNKPYFLSGGIGLTDVSQIQDFVKSNIVFALDVNSKFETTPGVKDMDKVKRFVEEIKILNGN